MLAATAHAQQQTTPPPPATPPQATPPAQRPDQIAFTAAMSTSNPEAKLAALEKFRADFPQSTMLATADSQILTTLLNWPDRLEAITTVFDRIIGRISENSTPEIRLSSFAGPCSQTIAKKVLLDRCEKLLNDGLAAINFEKWAQAARDTAARATPPRPEPKTEALQDQFNTVYKARALEQLGRLYLAKADNSRGEDFLKQAIKAAPSNSSAMSALVDYYVECDQFANAESLLKDAIKSSSTPAATSTATMMLADVYTKKGDDAAAEAVLKDAIKANSTNTTALLSLAKLEAKRADDKNALDHYLTAGAGSMLKSADAAAMRALYAKVNGSEAGLEKALDEKYKLAFPNPVTPEPYKPTAVRTDRIVLLEMFTGSGCPPCVSADLALDAAMERYKDAVVALAYHQNIPQPDPMVIAAGDARRTYYRTSAVPTFNIDGALGQLGGGARANTQGTYSQYIPKIDKALEAPATAALTVAATVKGDQIDVTATVTKLPADAKDLKLQLVIAEKELRFTGENGVRFHPMTVRAMAGELGAGIPITETGTTTWTVSLSSIRDDITKTLGAELEKRHKTEAPGSTPREYAAEGHAYTTIDVADLVVVAFVQQGAYSGPSSGGSFGSGPTPPPNTPNVLQTAIANVTVAGSPEGKAGKR